MSWLLPQQWTLLSVSSKSQVYMCIPLLRAAHCDAQTSISFRPEIQNAPNLYFQWTHMTLPLFSFARLVLWMFHPKWDAIGLGLPLEMPLAGTFSLCKRMCFWMRTSQKHLGNLAALWLNDKKCIENGHVWAVEKQFLSTLTSSRRNSVSVCHSVSLVHKPLVSLVVILLHEVWKYGNVHQWNCL